MTEIIKQTPDYKVTVGASTESGNNTYQIINKKWGVIEHESYFLPQALKYCSELQAALDAHRDMS